MPKANNTLGGTSSGTLSFFLPKKTSFLTVSVEQKEIEFPQVAVQ